MGLTLPMPNIPFLDKKSVVRAQLKTERKAAAAARPDAGRHAARNFMANIPFTDDMTVALYYPKGDELDTTALLEALLDRGCKIALPITPATRAPLEFKQFSPGDPLEQGRHGILCPEQSAPSAHPNIIVTPLLGFSRKGDRLGYGGGYYDRTLEAIRAGAPVLAVGYGFGAQEVDAFPTNAHDQPLDWVVTERAAVKFTPPPGSG